MASKDMYGVCSIRGGEKYMIGEGSSGEQYSVGVRISSPRTGMADGGRGEKMLAWRADNGGSYTSTGRLVQDSSPVQDARDSSSFSN